MRYVLIFSFLLSAANAMACECIVKTIKSNDDLKIYDFVALVKIERGAPKNDKLLWANGDIRFSVNELFKGDTRTAISIADFAFPCMQELPEKGEQLLVFGYIRDGKLFTSTCTFFRFANGKPSGYSIVSDLESLRQIIAKN